MMGSCHKPALCTSIPRPGRRTHRRLIRGMDKEWARALLSEERHRLELLLRSVEADHDRVVPVDEVSEDLVDGADRRTLEETDEAIAHQLTSRLQALQRAEGRLARAPTAVRS